MMSSTKNGCEVSQTLYNIGKMTNWIFGFSVTTGKPMTKWDYSQCHSQGRMFGGGVGDSNCDLEIQFPTV